MTSSLRDLILQRTSLAILLSLLATITKILGSIISGSIALLADGADSAINMSTIALAVYMFKRSKKKPDADHPYGHYGYEVLSSIITTIVMAVIATSIVMTVAYKLSHGYEVKGVGILFSAASTLMIALSTYILYQESKRHESLALRAEARHLAADILESVAVLVGVVLAVSMGYIYDAALALGVALFMGYGILANLREASESMTYRIPSEELMRKIESIARSVPGIRDCHAIRIRRLGGAIFVDMHVLVDPELTIREAHNLAHKVEELIRTRIDEVKDVVIHVEPAT